MSSSTDPQSDTEYVCNLISFTTNSHSFGWLFTLGGPQSLRAVSELISRGTEITHFVLQRVQEDPAAVHLFEGAVREFGLGATCSMEIGASPFEAACSSDVVIQLVANTIKSAPRLQSLVVRGLEFDHTRGTIFASSLRSLQISSLDMRFCVVYPEAAPAIFSAVSTLDSLATFHPGRGPELIPV